jgi:hypothetical protein
MNPRTIRYIISGPLGFLIDLYRNQPQWSPAAQDGMATGMAWLDLGYAHAKRRAAEEALGQQLGLTLVEMEKDPEHGWQLLNQSGVK